MRHNLATAEVVGLTVLSFTCHFPFLRGQLLDEGEVETREVIKALRAASPRGSSDY